MVGSWISQTSTVGVLTGLVTTSAWMLGARASSPPSTAANRIETRANDFMVVSFLSVPPGGAEPAGWHPCHLQSCPLVARRGRASLVWDHCRGEGRATTVVAATFRIFLSGCVPVAWESGA